MPGNSVSFSRSAFRSQLYSKKTFEDTPYVATRIQSWCLYWLAAMVVGACHNVVLDYNGPISFLGLFVVIFALQGAITEYRGIRVEALFIRIPLRPLPRLPMFTFWSKQIFLSEISSVTVKPPVFGIETVVVTTLRGHSWYAYFSGSSRILVGKKPRCDVAMSHNFQWLFGVFKGLKTGHDFGHEKTA